MRTVVSAGAAPLICIGGATEGNDVSAGDGAALLQAVRMNATPQRERARDMATLDAMDGIAIGFMRRGIAWWRESVTRFLSCTC